MAQTKQTNKSSDAKKIKDMEKTIEELNNLVQLLIKQGGTAQPVANAGERDVLFISLCNYTLNLSTEPNGGGTIYTFNEFGEEQSIPYSDARRIIKNNKSFIKGGKCYIADDEIVKAEHLTNDYKKILSKNDLLELLSAERSKFQAIFDSMTQTQKEIFRDVVVEKLTKNKNSVDMNIVQYINDSLNVNLLESIEFNKELLTDKN